MLHWQLACMQASCVRAGGWQRRAWYESAQGGPFCPGKRRRPAGRQLGGDHHVMQRLILQQVRARLAPLHLRRPFHLCIPQYGLFRPLRMPCGSGPMLLPLSLIWPAQ